MQWLLRGEGVQILSMSLLAMIANKDAIYNVILIIDTSAMLNTNIGIFADNC